MNKEKTNTIDSVDEEFLNSLDIPTETAQKGLLLAVESLGLEELSARRIVYATIRSRLGLETDISIKPKAEILPKFMPRVAEEWMVKEMLISQLVEAGVTAEESRIFLANFIAHHLTGIGAPDKEKEKHEIVRLLILNVSKGNPYTREQIEEAVKPNPTSDYIHNRQVWEARRELKKDIENTLNRLF